MKEIYEFRVREKFVHLLSKPDIGVRLQIAGRPFYRMIKVQSSDALFHEIATLDAELSRTRHENLFLFWDIHRSYSEEELRSAELFRLFIARTFEPSGEECGTRYDDTVACSSCGAGAPQVSSLFLDSRKLPRSYDLARTIAGEWVVSQSLAAIFNIAGLRGADFGAVYHKALFEQDPFDLSKLDCGRKMLQLARARGLERGTAEYYVWLNRQEQRTLLDEATLEYVRRREKSERRRPGPVAKWRQLIVSSNRVSAVDPTRAGASPFDGEAPDSGRCVRGDTIGLRWVSEISVVRSEWDGSDIFLTKQYTGRRSELLRPEPAILVTPRVRTLLRDNNIKGARCEVAHFV